MRSGRRSERQRGARAMQKRRHALDERRGPGPARLEQRGRRASRRAGSRSAAACAPRRRQRRTRSAAPRSDSHIRPDRERRRRSTRLGLFDRGIPARRGRVLGAGKVAAATSAGSAVRAAARRAACGQHLRQLGIRPRRRCHHRRRRAGVRRFDRARRPHASADSSALGERQHRREAIVSRARHPLAQHHCRPRSAGHATCGASGSGSPVDDRRQRRQRAVTRRTAHARPAACAPGRPARTDRCARRCRRAFPAPARAT